MLIIDVGDEILWWPILLFLSPIYSILLGQSQLSKYLSPTSVANIDLISITCLDRVTMARCFQTPDMRCSPSRNIESWMTDLFSTTEDGQNGNPIDFDNDFIKLESHLALQTKLIFRIDSIFCAHHSCLFTAIYSCLQ